MKRLLHKLNMSKSNGISEQSMWTLLCGLSCIAAVLISAQISFADSAYFYSAMISLSLRLVALTVMLSAIVDIIIGRGECE